MTLAGFKACMERLNPDRWLQYVPVAGPVLLAAKKRWHEYMDSRRAAADAEEGREE